MQVLVEQLHKCSFALKFKILVQKNAAVCVYLYHTAYHTILQGQQEQYDKRQSVNFVPIYQELKCDFCESYLLKCEYE